MSNASEMIESVEFKIANVDLGKLIGTCLAIAGKAVLTIMGQSRHDLGARSNSISERLFTRVSVNNSLCSRATQPPISYLAI